MSEAAEDQQKQAATKYTLEQYIGVFVKDAFDVLAKMCQLRVSGVENFDPGCYQGNFNARVMKSSSYTVIINCGSLDTGIEISVKAADGTELYSGSPDASTNPTGLVQPACKAIQDNLAANQARFPKERIW